MFQLSPDTDATCQIRDCYDHAAGYSYNDPTIQGFSHTHFSGAGHSDLGDILVMPQVGPVDSVKLDPGDPAKPGSGYRQRFDHKTEKASPGYYAVTLARSEEHTSELQSLMRISYAVFCLKKKKQPHTQQRCRRLQQ